MPGPALGSWTCQNCGASCSNLTPDFCPLCGASPDDGGYARFSIQEGRSQSRQYVPRDDLSIPDSDTGDLDWSDTSSTSTAATSHYGNLNLQEELTNMIWGYPSVQILTLEACGGNGRYFERKLNRLLGRMAIKLRSEAADKRQQHAAKFVARNARTVSSAVCRKAKRISTIFTSSSVRRQPKSETTNVSEIRNPLAPDVNESSSEEEDNPGDYDDPLVDETEQSTVIMFKSFITTSSAFITFLESLENVVYPTLSSKLIEYVQHSEKNPIKPEEQGWVVVATTLGKELYDIPPSAVTVLTKRKESYLNTLKAAIEACTEETWNWWPLEPVRLPLGKNRAEVQWHCACGEERWMEVPKSFASALEDLIEQLPMGRSQVTAVSPFQQSTTQTSTREQTQSEITESHTQATQSNTPLPSGDIATQGASRPVLNSTPLRGRVLFVVQSRTNHSLTQLKVDGITTRDFFKKMRSEYSRLRGFLCFHFSIWGFSHCDFYEFSKYDSLAIAPRKKHQYPPLANLDYDYAPKPISDIPPITKHEFKHRFDSCATSSISKFHIRCTPSCHCTTTARKAHNREILTLLPKKLTSLDENSDEREAFWGLYARQGIQFSRVLVYNIVCISPLVWFLVMWVVMAWGGGEGRDLEGASVPLMVMLSLLSVFWSSFMACVRVSGE